MADEPSTAQDWDVFREVLESSVTPITWQTWPRPLRRGPGANDHMTVLAPSDFHLRWVRDKFEDLLRDASLTAFGADIELLLVAEAGATISEETEVDPGEDQDSPVIPVHIPHPELANGNPSNHARLVGRYRFENFVVGPSNRFAWAASMAVAEQPGTHYNPLFIYAGAGLGKTHLLNAVGHAALELHPGCTVRYVSSENFFNEFIDGIRRKRMDEFKHRYRTTDILLLDDVQFFDGKEQILEEFFHTFNSLYESGKQMVISSDRSPRRLMSLEDRLRSRFEWGLLTDIQAPDVETRLAILRKNVESSPYPVPEDVLLHRRTRARQRSRAGRGTHVGHRIRRPHRATDRL